jgi:hypothetical protein
VPPKNYEESNPWEEDTGYLNIDDVIADLDIKESITGAFDGYEDVEDNE